MNDAHKNCSYNDKLINESFGGKKGKRSKLIRQSIGAGPKVSLFNLTVNSSVLEPARWLIGEACLLGKPDKLSLIP